MLEFADRLLLRNGTGKTVTVYGYSGEPYARVLRRRRRRTEHALAGGLPEHQLLRRRDRARLASATAPPTWEAVDRTGQFEWHDHRIHWMSPVTPPEVKNTAKRTKIFDWTVPIRVGDQPGAIRGELFWVPRAPARPPAAISWAS